jgi:hypothetical protein
MFPERALAIPLCLETARNDHLDRYYFTFNVTTYPLSILVIASRRRRRSNPLAWREIAFPTLRSTTLRSWQAGHALRSQ